MGIIKTHHIVNGVIKYLNATKKGKYGKVHYPVFIMILGLICVALFGTITLITTFSNEPLWVIILFLSMATLGLIPVIMFINCRIVYDENGFAARNFLGIKRRFTYAQVTSITNTTKNDSFVHIGNKKVLVDAFSVGGREFVSYVKRKYMVTHNGKNVPVHKKETKW